MRSLLSVYLIGPLATLYTINAKGWPLIFTLWGTLNFILIKGHELTLVSHWLSFTDIEMFTEQNPSGGVVESVKYHEILVSMLIAGIATSVKRTVLALYLGKRIYFHYKPRLEKLMEMMILLTEVADLGNAIDEFDFERENEPKKPSPAIYTDNIRTYSMKSVVTKKDIDWSKSYKEQEGDSEDESKRSDISNVWNNLRLEENYSLEDESKMIDKSSSKECIDITMARATQERDDVLHVPTTQAYSELSDDKQPNPTRLEPQNSLWEASTTAQLESLLDGWEEPVNKADKLEDPTIHEILQFRKALSFLDDTQPFGSSFGPSFSRDTCIQSSKNLYKRLLAMSPGSSVLNFDIIGVLAYDADGVFDDDKAKCLVRLFRPDKFDEGKNVIQRLMLV